MVIDKCKCIENLIEKYREYTHCRDICLRWDDALSIEVSKVPMKFNDADAFFAMCMGQTIYVDYVVEPLTDAETAMYGLCDSLEMPEFLQGPVVSEVLDNLDKYPNCAAFINCLCDEMNTTPTTCLIFYSPKINASFVEVQEAEFPSQLTCDAAIDEVFEISKALMEDRLEKKKPELVS